MSDRIWLRLAHLLRIVSAWLSRRADAVDPPSVRLLSVPVDALYHSALPLVQSVERTEVTASGENKAHQVRSRLMKQFPLATGRAINLAIEAAVQEKQ